MTVLTKPLPVRVVLFMVALTVLTVFIAVSALPQNRYIRFQSLRGTLHARAEWVFDRIHSDPTPIDIVIVGPSRTAVGIDGALLHRLIRDETGADLKVANLGFAEPGPNLAYLMLRETMEVKQPRLVIVGILEQQTRNGHPAFKDLADATDIVASPIVVNWDYFRNLIFLPMRQLRLAADTLFAPLLGYRRHFDPAAYGGADLDLIEAFPVNKTPPATVAQLDDQIGMLRDGLTHPFLPSSLGAVEFAAQRTYFNKMKMLADAHGAKLLFVYFRSYKGPSLPLDLSFYEKLAPVISPPTAITDDPENYFDVGHLNARGRDAFTAWLATTLDGDTTLLRSVQGETYVGGK